ncbi:MAG: crossover junction endodeoxyribonuclease RuvC [Chlorobium sp.]|nr:MAG: crossover junction endodeoxyribonuclease RuvC [Chlorobium sp.]
MVVLGIDPGSLKTGYGVIRCDSQGCSVLVCGLIRLHSSRSHPERIGEICRELGQVIADFQPERVALETAFLSRNVQSALKLGQVRGAVIALAMSHNLALHEYAPREVKSAITGRGAASKEQVAFMVARMLSLSSVPEPYDVTDALGLALCDLLRGGSRQKRTTQVTARGKSRSWSSFISKSPDMVIREFRAEKG